MATLKLTRNELTVTDDAPIPAPATPDTPTKPRRHTLYQGITALVLTALPALLLFTSIMGSASHPNDSSNAGETFIEALFILGPIMTIIGIIFGHIALLKPVQGSRIPAILALIIGYGGALIVILFLGGLFLFFANWHD